MHVFFRGDELHLVPERGTDAKTIRRVKEVAESGKLKVKLDMHPNPEAALSFVQIKVSVMSNSD